MAKLKLDVVTAERAVFSGDVDMVLVPGVQGQLGILPNHTHLMTMMEPGELLIRMGEEEIDLAVSGGFVEVTPERVVVLADAAERAQDIDIQRAEAAKVRALQALAHGGTVGPGEATTEAALRRAMARIRVSQKEQVRKKPRGLV